MTETYSGGCACGAVQYEIMAAPMFVHCCHCTECQRLTGSAFVMNALIETAHIRIKSGDLTPVSVPTHSGGPHDIYHCSSCQTALWSDYGRKPALRYLRVGTLDEPSRLPPDVHIFTRSKLPWVDLSNEAAVFDVYYHQETLWPAENYARRRAVETA
jgi:hypothetical protein